MTQTDISQICSNAQGAFDIYKTIVRKKRYDFLRTIAKNLLHIQNDIITTAHHETYLSVTDLTQEFNRTIFQIHTYSETLLTHHHCVSNNNLSLGYEPIGCVAVFGASNFPLAYSTIGGDVVCALVAGCSVIFKAHEAHAQTSALVASAIAKAIFECAMPQYVYQHLPDLPHEQATLLVQNDVIKAVGFTGSLAVGRHLFDLCQKRPEPIPFFGELGAINPIFICKDIFEHTYQDIAFDYAQAFTKRGGQLCVNPAVLVVPKTTVTTYFYALLNGYFKKAVPQKMLTDNILSKFKQVYDYRKENYPLITDNRLLEDDNTILPVLFSVSIDDWLCDETLKHEVFGMMGIIVEYETHDDLYHIAQSFSGQLTASIHGNLADKPTMESLETILTPKVGRLVYNAYPTSVHVDDNMQHGGVYPASTCSQFTAVGKRAISRFVRPICYDNKPDFLQDYTNKHDYYVVSTQGKRMNTVVNSVAQKINNAVLDDGHAYLGITDTPYFSTFLEILLGKNIKWDCVTLYVLTHHFAIECDISMQTFATLSDIIPINTQDNNELIAIKKCDCFVFEPQFYQKHNDTFLLHFGQKSDMVCCVTDDKELDTHCHSLFQSVKMTIFSIEK